MATVPLLSLNSGALVPQIGFGVFQVPPEETQRVVEDALEVGYRHIDTATGYENEAEVGAAIRASGLPRGDVFVTTKLRNDHHKQRDVDGAFQRSLDALDLGYIDLYLIHWPLPASDLYVDTWRGLERFAADGRARSIGVSNFLVPHLERLLAETDTVPAVNQVELHPAFAQPELRAFHERHGIRTEAWGPLGQNKYDLFGLPAIRETAAAHGVQPAQVVLRWHLQLGNIVIPKSTSKERMAQNLDILAFELSPEEMARIGELDEGRRVGGHPEDVN
jgi:2,5-diketo-D-gluconate reductase A